MRNRCSAGSTTRAPARYARVQIPERWKHRPGSLQLASVTTAVAVPERDVTVAEVRHQPGDHEADALREHRRHAHDKGENVEQNDVGDEADRTHGAERGQLRDKASR